MATISRPVSYVPPAVRRPRGPYLVRSPLSLGGAPSPLLAVYAAWGGLTLRVYFSATLDPAVAATVDPASYAVTTPAGTLGVSSVSIDPDGRSVSLNLSGVPATGACTVTIDENAAKSTTGSTFAGATLDFTAPDTLAPHVSDFSPSPGTELQTDAPIAFNVVDDTGLRPVVVVVRYEDIGAADLAHDGADFVDTYEGTRTPIAGGFRYSLVRRGGWPAAPTIQVFAVDTAGNEAA